MTAKGLDIHISPSMVWQLGEEYGIDTGFALSTFVWETGWGTQSQAWVNANNPAGIICGTEYCAYNSTEEGFEAMFELLNNYVIGSIDYVGQRITVAEVRSTWSESEDTDDVVRIWNEILQEE